MSTGSGLGALFIVGLAICLVLARGGGFPFDMSSFGAWAGTLADKGPWNFYPFGSENSFFVDYPPGYLYVLWAIGSISKLLWNSGPSVLLIKLPAILADLGLAWAVAVLAHRLTPAGVARRTPVRAIAAAAILLNPAVFFVSAVWGQADSVLALLVVGAFILLGTGTPTFRREAGAMALLAVALGTKPQVVFVVPIAVLLLVWRHLFRGVAENEDPVVRRRAVRLGIGRLVALAGTGIAAGLLLFLPFRLYPARAVDFYLRSSRTYKVTSVFAFNFWGAVGFWKPDSGNAPEAIRILGVPAVIVGIVAFIVIGGLVGVRSWQALRGGQDEGRVLVFGGVAMALVSFAVVTRVHERYLFLPLALLAVLTANRWLRRAFVVLSGLYMLNIYFPYVYYLDYVHRPAPKLGGLYDLLYGNDIHGGRMRLLCLIVGASCLVIAWLGWRAVEAKRDESIVPPDDDVVLPVVAPVPPAGEGVPVQRGPWSLGLHPVGRGGAALALGVFALAFVMRVAGLGHPPGMYFDEVYHARAGAEYLGHKEVFEYTHPPLAKEIIGFSIQRLSGFFSKTGGQLGSDVAASTVAPRPNGILWARNAAGQTRVQLASVDGDCNPHATNTLAFADMSADAAASSDTSSFVAGSADGASTLVRFQGSDEVWRATLPGPATDVVTVGERAFVVTRDGDLVTVSPEGEPQTLAVGAEGVSAAGGNSEVWVSFPSDRRIASYDVGGSRTSTIETPGKPLAIVAHHASERVFVTIGDEIVVFDSEHDTEQARIKGGASLLGAVPETSVVWAVDGTKARVIEPLSAVVIGRVDFDLPPERLTADQGGHRLLGISDHGVECAGGRPQFAWRLGSAITGAAMVAFAFLLALRLFGNLVVAALGALFLAIDGLAFTISRIAMNDSYSMAFVLAAWFCAVSALYAWGRRSGGDQTGSTAGRDEAGPSTFGPGVAEASARPPDDAAPDPPRNRSATIAWLVGAGLLGGAGLASKWPALYALAAIGLLMLWDGFSRRERSIWRVAGGFVPSGILILVLLVAVPLGVYFLTYIPYMSLGHSFTEVLRLQRGMFDYHATLKATHPYGSPWYGWPFGYRAVYLYVHNTPTTRAEIWTFPNLVVFWGGLVALASAVMHTVRTRSAAVGILVVAAAVQYLPWTVVTRVTFMYHYLPVVPFLALLLAWFLVEGARGLPYQRQVLIGTVGLAIAFFFFIYPILVGWEMPIWYLDATRLFAWVIP
jgi:4-amino-4-deoxy-L-arabinose transferase-like glycosyltransferase